MVHRLAGGGHVVDVDVVADQAQVRLAEQDQRDLAFAGGELVLVQTQGAEDHAVDHRVAQAAGYAQFGSGVAGGVVHQDRAAVAAGRRDDLDRQLREVRGGQFGEGQGYHAAAAGAQLAGRHVGV